MNTMPINLWQFVMSVPEGDRFPLVLCAILFGILGVVGIVAIVGGTIRSMHRYRLEDALKRELVDRGMSAEEIERIVRAKSGKHLDTEANLEKTSWRST